MTIENIGNITEKKMTPNLWSETKLSAEEQ